MSSLIPTGDIAFFTGRAGDLFDTFKRNIIVHKEPVKSITQSAANVYFGYGETQSPADYTYEMVSGVYPAVVTYQRFSQHNLESPFETKSLVNRNTVQIKVEQAARDFIQNGKTENIIVDGNTFNVASEPITQNFLGKLYYIYDLEATF